VTRKPVKANVRIGKSGPMPHTAFILCGEVNGVRLHIPGVTHQNTHDPVFQYDKVMECNQWSCKGWMTVSDHACAWLEGIAARKANEEPMRGAT
jgi:hypothetical protein